MVRSDDALTRLILIVVRWSEWRPRLDRPRYEQFIDTFFRGSSAHSGGANPVYMHQCYEKTDPKTSSDRDDPYTSDNGVPITEWVEQAAPYELPSKYDCCSPDVWLASDDALRRVAFVPEAERVAEGAKLPIHQVTDWGRLFRTRLFMDADSYRAILKCGGDSSYWVLIDMRFQRVPEGSVLWHTSFSFWSDPPWCKHHRPGSVNAPKRKEFKAQYAYDLIEDWSSNSIPTLRSYSASVSGLLWAG